jgi:hypothetical protein
MLDHGLIAPSKHHTKVVADATANRDSARCWYFMVTQLMDELRQFLG